MQAALITLGLSFLEGFALIISPCILPILPLVLAGSINGNKKRPLGIIIGFVLAFSLFTFFSRVLVQITGIDLNLIRHVSFGILCLLGIIMLSSYLTEQFSRLTQRLSNLVGNLSFTHQQEGGLVSGLFLGGLIALVWTPCAGPILAAVIVQTVLQETNSMSFLILFAFGVGAAFPMLLIAIFGQDLITRGHYFKTHGTMFRKILGLIIILSVLAMIYSEAHMSSSSSVALSVNEQEALQLEQGLLKPYAAPPIAGIEAWINSKPLTISDLKGKVVLIDFWTYSCINCLRTLPYLKAWYDKYHDRGLVIIGVHSPEFDFERKLANVQNAVQKLGLKYSIALDNQFVTWRNYKNSYWPAHYLIDKQGKVVYTHFGEGSYEVTENNIQYLLGVVAPRVNASPEMPSLSLSLTPETYLGYARVEHFFDLQKLVENTSAHYDYPSELSENEWALQGPWIIKADSIIAQKAEAAMKINFHAHKVYLVMGSADGKPVQVKLRLNGQAIAKNMQGEDVVNSALTVEAHTLYRVLALTGLDHGELEVIASSPGLQLYTVTFGE